MHDGNAFAMHVKAMDAKTPGERRWLRQHPESPPLLPIPGTFDFPTAKAAADAKHVTLQTGVREALVGVSSPEIFTPPPEKKPEAARVSAREGNWTVHDGNVFAQSVFMDSHPHQAPASRTFLRSDSQRRYSMNWTDRSAPPSSRIARAEKQALASATLLREHEHRPTDGDGVGVDEGSLHGTMTPSPGQSGHGGSAGLGVVMPPALGALGGTVVSMREFATEETIGMGMFSSVHAARRVSDDHTVAIKIWHRPIALKQRQAPNTALSPGNSSAARYGGDADDERDAAWCDPQDVACFTSEVTLLSSLSHPNIVRYLGHGFITTPEGYNGFIVLELVDGKDLVRARPASAARRARPPRTGPAVPAPRPCPPTLTSPSSPPRSTTCCVTARSAHTTCGGGRRRWRRPSCTCTRRN